MNDTDDDNITEENTKSVVSVSYTHLSPQYYEPHSNQSQKKTDLSATEALYLYPCLLYTSRCV